VNWLGYVVVISAIFLGFVYLCLVFPGFLAVIKAFCGLGSNVWEEACEAAKDSFWIPKDQLEDLYSKPSDSKTGEPDTSGGRIIEL